MPQDVEGASSKTTTFRVSLACIACRSRHLRCDAVTPICSRCRDSGSQCVYTKSRRGGRTRIHGTATKTAANFPSPLTPTTQRIPISAPAAGVVANIHLTESELAPGLVSDVSESALSENSSSIVHDLTTPPEQRWHDWNCLMDLYYEWFHDAHPLVLPPSFLKQRMMDASSDLKVLVLVMKYIGAFYARHFSSDHLERAVEDELARPSAPGSKYEVQALILYSIAVYWSNHLLRARELLTEATRKALALGMNYRGFDLQHSEGDPVLAESLRRTWWQLYFVDAHVAGSNHEPTFGTSQRYISATVDLPCEEAQYNSGNIPEPQTLESYDNRELALDGDIQFSSFGYVIGLVRSLDHVCIGISRDSVEHVKELCANADAAIGAWKSLLSKSKRSLFRNDGSLDELIYKAHTLIEVCTVDMHRLPSTLLYSPIEAISTCAPPPPPYPPQPVDCREASIHTAKILHSIERMTGLLTLPTRMAAHTPFTICMIAMITIGHLSACKYALSGKQLNLARERIRVAIGAIEAFAEVWPRGKKVLREVKLIARELLGLEKSRSSSPGTQGEAFNSAEKPDTNTIPDNTLEAAFFSAVSCPDFLFSGSELDFALGADFDPRTVFPLDVSVQQ